MAHHKVKESVLKDVRRADEQFNELSRDYKETMDSALEKRVSLPQCEDQGDHRASSLTEAKKIDAPVIRPIRQLTTNVPFNEKFRKEWERDWTYVKAVFENNEIIGEGVECWTKKYPGDPAHFWKVPVNRPVMVPRIVADQIAQCKYHRVVMNEQPRESSGGMTFYGAIEAVEVKHRLNAHIVNDESSIAIGY